MQQLNTTPPHVSSASIKPTQPMIARPNPHQSQTPPHLSSASIKPTQPTTARLNPHTSQARPPHSQHNNLLSRALFPTTPPSEYGSISPLSLSPAVSTPLRDARLHSHDYWQTQSTPVQPLSPEEEKTPFFDLDDIEDIQANPTNIELTIPLQFSALPNPLGDAPSHIHDYWQTQSTPVQPLRPQEKNDHFLDLADIEDIQSIPTNTELTIPLQFSALPIDGPTQQQDTLTAQITPTRSAPPTSNTNTNSTKHINAVTYAITPPCHNQEPYSSQNTYTSAPENNNKRPYSPHQAQKLTITSQQQATISSLLKKVLSHKKEQRLTISRDKKSELIKSLDKAMIRHKKALITQIKLVNNFNVGAIINAPNTINHPAFTYIKTVSLISQSIKDIVANKFNEAFKRINTLSTRLTQDQLTSLNEIAIKTYCEQQFSTIPSLQTNTELIIHSNQFISHLITRYTTQPLSLNAIKSDTRRYIIALNQLELNPSELVTGCQSIIDSNPADVINNSFQTLIIMALIKQDKLEAAYTKYLELDNTTNKALLGISLKDAIGTQINQAIELRLNRLNGTLTPNTITSIKTKCMLFRDHIIHHIHQGDPSHFLQESNPNISHTFAQHVIIYLATLVKNQSNHFNQSHTITEQAIKLEGNTALTSLFQIEHINALKGIYTDTWPTELLNAIAPLRPHHITSLSNRSINSLISSYKYNYLKVARAHKTNQTLFQFIAHAQATSDTHSQSRKRPLSESGSSHHQKHHRLEPPTSH